MLISFPSVNALLWSRSCLAMKRAAVNRAATLPSTDPNHPTRLVSLLTWLWVSMCAGLVSCSCEL